MAGALTAMTQLYLIVAGRVRAGVPVTVDLKRRAPISITAASAHSLIAPVECRFKNRMVMLRG
jgi:hypothetical protein